MDNDVLTSQFNGVRDIDGNWGFRVSNSPAQTAWGAAVRWVSPASPAIFRAGARANEGPFISRNRTYQILDNVSWVHGNHTIKFGVEVADRRYNNFGNQFQRGNLVVRGPLHGRRRLTSSAPGTLLPAACWAGCRRRRGRWVRPTCSTGREPTTPMSRTPGRSRPTLTINLGVRYENVPPWQDRYRGALSVKMAAPGVDDTGIDESCPMPVLVRTGRGRFPRRTEGAFRRHHPESDRR